MSHPRPATLAGIYNLLASSLLSIAITLLEYYEYLRDIVAMAFVLQIAILIFDSNAN
jgi:hypothetical protein